MDTLEQDGGNGHRLAQLCQEIAVSQGLVVASNRGPVTYETEGDGGLTAARGGGGVAVALSALNRYLGFTWVAAAMGDGDRRACRDAKGGMLTADLDGQRFRLRFVDMPQGMYHKHYSVFCNPFLWFFQHGMCEPSYSPKKDGELWHAWEEGYVPANRAFAEAVAAQYRVEGSPYVMLHDYHLYLAPGYLRQRLPKARIHHFTHIPWPPTLAWALLPKPVTVRILRSLCCCDMLGMQTMRDVHNFLNTCRHFLRGAGIDHEACTVQLDGRRTRVGAYPISVDVHHLGELAGSDEAARYEEMLRPLLGRQTIMRVDRLEPTKNILRGFEAYDLLLSRHPELTGQVRFLAFLVPSRTGLREYQEYGREVFRKVEEINGRHGQGGWEPVKVFYENNYTQAIAAMGLYDVLLVNTNADGMNLVAKEGPVVNRRNGVLVLSKGAGAHEQLRGNALSVAPEDIAGTARAMHEALIMPSDERRRRAQALKETMRQEDIAHWFWRQLKDLHGEAEPPMSQNREMALAGST